MLQALCGQNQRVIEDAATSCYRDFCRLAFGSCRRDVYGVSISSQVLGYQSPAKYIAAPALVFSGWAALGHLVTLDDDAPDEWSNPEGSKATWHRSIGELIIKIVVFAAVGIAFYAYPHNQSLKYAPGRTGFPLHSKPAA